MSVRLIAISKPVVSDCSETSELLAFCARVSSTANQGNHATGPKLLRSLIQRKEWSPFEMVSLTVEITTTRDIARQVLRHRSFSFQEFSQRYAEIFDTPIYREARTKHPTDRQKSLELDESSDYLAAPWQNAQKRVWETAIEEYRAALDSGISKEVARALLPEGLTPSRIYMAGTLRSYLHYVEARYDDKTQKEHRLIAVEIEGVIREQFPMLYEGRT